MPDFLYIKNLSNKWTILDPRRGTRPDESKNTEPPVCPFCPGREKEEPDVFRIKNEQKSETNPHVQRSDNKNVSNLDIRVSSSERSDMGWLVRVIPNKFPFADIHEIIIHSPDHHKNIDELPLSQVELIFKTYRNRFNTYKNDGQVYIFHNHGEQGGESLPHPHTQLAVLPFTVSTDMPILLFSGEDTYETKDFTIFSPLSSQWPDEVWIVPKRRKQLFGSITDQEITDLSYVLQQTITLLDMRHGHEFPFNFYIYPGQEWYLRIIPRVKFTGGLEVGTGIFVNTQDPKETIEFIKEHFGNPDVEKIKKHHQASYRKSV